MLALHPECRRRLLPLVPTDSRSLHSRGRKSPSRISDYPGNPYTTFSVKIFSSTVDNSNIRTYLLAPQVIRGPNARYRQLSWCMGYIAENSRRFFHPSAIGDMLSTFLPLMDGTVLDVRPCRVSCFFVQLTLLFFQTLLSTQFHLLSFLPLSHPQSYLPMLMRMWESINSYMYDERMLHFLAKLAEMHVSPEVSDPHKIAEIPDDEISEGETRPRWSQDDVSEDSMWPGLYKDVGIFTEHEWSLLMCKCLASMGAFASPSYAGLLAHVPCRNTIGRLWLPYHRTFGG